VEKTSQHDVVWPTGAITVKNGDKNEELKIRYCLADFLSGIERYQAHFMPVSSAEWHNEMVSLPDYIDPDFKNSDNSVPYISMADKNGNLYRVIVTKTLCNLCLNAKNLWRNLQELGGINNSHVLKQVALESKKIEEKMTAEIEKVRAGHKEEMEQTVEDLTNEIISNIASGLLSDEMISIGSGAVATPQAQTTPAETTKTETAEKKETKEPEKAAAEEEDEEEMAFNDPYIDTPLCTSCNDCMNVNSQMFGYDENKQAYIKDPKAGTFKDLVTAAEKCPVKIIHPGKPLNPDEPGLDELVKIAEKYN
jgi:ferredoxin